MTIKYTIMSDSIKKFLLGLGAAASMASCVNPEYDLENIKVDQIHGLDNISVPVGDSRKIVLSELLDTEELGAYLKTYDNGDYYLNLMSGKKDQAVDVPYFSFEGFDDNYRKHITVNYLVNIPQIIHDKKLGPIEFGEIVYSFELGQTDIPEVVVDIDYADVETNLIVDIEYELSKFPFQKIYLERGLTLQLPNWIIIGDAPEPFIKKDGHKLEASKDVIMTPSGIEFIIPIDALDFSKMPEGQGFLGNGQLYINDEVKMSGNLYLMSDDCTQTGEFYPIFSTDLHLDPMVVESVRTKVDLSKIAFIETSFELDEITEFLENEDYTLDLDGLKLDLGVETTIPFAIDLYAAAASYESGSDEPMWTGNFNLLDIPAGTADAPSVSSYSFELDDFPLYPIPEKIDFSLLPLVSDMQAVEIQPGASYDVAVDYALTCDAFGKDFSISINEEFTGWGLEVTDVDVAEAQVKFTLINALPFDFHISAETIDEEGNILNDLSAVLEGEIKGGSVEAPAVNKLTLKLLNEGDLKLDGLRLSMSTNVSGERAVLNKDQFIQLADVSVCLPKGVTYYINENN